MYNHEPLNYACPFCILIEGKETEYNSPQDVVYEDATTLAYVSPKWWVNNPGNVLVVPKEHIENLYSISDKILADVYKVVKQVAIGIRTTYLSEGISTRQHNEPAGNQDVWHFHVHVFPRYIEDNLYLNHKNKRWVSKDEKKEYVDKLKNYFSNL